MWTEAEVEDIIQEAKAITNAAKAVDTVQGGHSPTQMPLFREEAIIGLEEESDDTDEDDDEHHQE